MVYSRFPSQQEFYVGSVSNRGRRWGLADRSTGEHIAAFPTRTAAARLVSRMSSEAEELSDAGQGAISAEESLSEGSGRDETGSCRNRKNKTGIKRSPSEWDPICTNVSEDEVLQAVENTRKVELGVGSLVWAKNIWKPKPPLFNKGSESLGSESLESFNRSLVCVYERVGAHNDRLLM